MDVIGIFLNRLPRFLPALLLLIVHSVQLLAINPANVWGATEGKSESHFDGFLAAQRSDAELNDLFVLSPDHLWAVGERGTILFSEDGGRNCAFRNQGQPVLFVVFTSRIHKEVGRSDFILHLILSVPMESSYKPSTVVSVGR
jgi:photosystem II stability/assembly factor-like uncharacterized protein